ncbi:MAG: pirin family protein [Polyangiales bacterium]
MSRMTRREALKALAASGAVIAGCDPSDPEPPAEGASSGAEKNEPGDPVLSVDKLGSPPWATQDPFLFCVHHDDRYPAGNEQLGPAASLDGRNLGNDFQPKDGWRMYHGQKVPGFPRHPHRGFETVTVVRRGLIDHSDSLGAAARYGQGDVQWLTAGEGIMHAEMFPLLDRDDRNPVDFFQIWLNLPRADKMVAPHFSMLWSDEIPRRTARDAEGRTTEVTAVAGAYGDLKPPSPPPKSYASQPDSEVAIWTMKMQAGAKHPLPAASSGTERTLYVFDGAGVKIAGRTVRAGYQAHLRADVETELVAGSGETEILMLQGRPIGEPVVQHGPFVMNTRAEIQQAFADYRRTRFGQWRWTSDENVHGRKDRFARHADGKVERPG